MIRNLLIFKKIEVVLRWGFMSLFATLFLSCSNDNYIDVMPRDVQLLMSIDVGKSTGTDSRLLLKALLKATDVDESGIDLSVPLYCFETRDGQFGFCAKVDSKSDLTDMLTTMSKGGTATEPVESHDCQFSLCNDAWLVGYNGDAMLVMGPISKDERAALQRKMGRMFEQDAEMGVRSSAMYEKLETLSAPITMVAQAQALPEKLVAAFTLGAPKDADASQVILAAEMEVNDGILKVNGETFSFNKNIDAALKDAAQVYRPIEGKYAKSMPKDALMGWFMNVDGKKFLPLLQADKGLQAMLAGINAAIDMDNILRSVDGDMAMVSPVFNDEKLQLSMSVQLANADWLKDVGYWKQSCPPGGKITDWEKNSYCYSDGSTRFYFGVTDDKQFYSGSSEERALASVKAADKPIDDSLQKEITGAKMVMIVNLASVNDDSGAVEMVLSLLNPLFGKVSTVVYSMK